MRVHGQEISCLRLKREALGLKCLSFVAPNFKLSLAYFVLVTVTDRNSNSSRS